MRPALDRLLARPSALRLLRSIVVASGPPTIHLPRCAAQCLCGTSSPRKISSRSSNRREWSHWNRDTAPRNAVKSARPDNQHEGGITHIGALVEILQQDERRRGAHGIHYAWNARCKSKLDLPTDETPEAGFLWGTFFKNERLVEIVIDYAVELRERTGQVHPHLYELCMSYWLGTTNVKQALHYHSCLQSKLKLERLPLQRLWPLIQGRISTHMSSMFRKEIYLPSTETNLYDVVVPRFWDGGRRTEARQWHATCLRKGDYPSPEVASKNRIRKRLRDDTVTPDASNRLAVAIYSNSQMDEDLLRRVRGQDAAPVRFEDAFCAKFFATTAIAHHSVIKGLAMVGVNEIGPMAVHAMASRTHPITDLAERFEELRAAGITLQGCVFSVALEHFAKEKQFSLVQSMLESDQHPEVYDDTKLQEELLDYYLEQHDWIQARRTLAILSLFRKDKATAAWNLLLQTHIKRVAPDAIYSTLRSMGQERINVSLESVLTLKRLLRHRQKHRRPVHFHDSHHIEGKFDDLRFVTQMFIVVLESGIGTINPEMWWEILRRYGMTGRIRELRRLVHWLACRYREQGDSLGDKLEFLVPTTRKLLTPHHSNSGQFHTVHPTSKEHPLRVLFTKSFQQALVIWGFRSGLLPEAPIEQSMLSKPAGSKQYRRRLRASGILQPNDWSIGLRTVCEMRQLGVLIPTNTVVQALQLVFLKLFSPRRPSQKVHARMAASNDVSYDDYVRRVNEIWFEYEGRPLLPGPALVGTSDLHRYAWLPHERHAAPNFVLLSDIEDRANAHAHADVDNGTVEPFGSTHEAAELLEQLGPEFSDGLFETNEAQRQIDTEHDVGAEKDVGAEQGVGAERDVDTQHQ